jgi:hydroxymethylbilane synthase
VTLRIGTRGSALALAQAGTVAALLEAAGAPAELVVVRTEGDVSHASLAAIGGTGVFAGALRRSLADGGCDLVVHSLKDLPVQPAAGLVVVAVPEREDPRDALCSRGPRLADLPAGARVGTGSPRRRAQLLERRPDLTVVDLRGNVDSRLRRVADGELDAVLLSVAGLTRLGRPDAITEVLPLEDWATAAGQGALALEVRAEDARSLDGGTPTAIGKAAARLDDADTHDLVAAERTVLGELQAGCVAPIGVASSLADGAARIWASVHRPDGGSRVQRSVDVALERIPDRERRAVLVRAAQQLAADLVAHGAADLAPLGATA